MTDFSFGRRSTALNSEKDKEREAFFKDKQFTFSDDFFGGVTFTADEYKPLKTWGTFNTTHYGVVLVRDTNFTVFAPRGSHATHSSYVPPEFSIIYPQLMLFFMDDWKVERGDEVGNKFAQLLPHQALFEMSIPQTGRDYVIEKLLEAYMMQLRKERFATFLNQEFVDKLGGCFNDGVFDKERFLSLYYGFLREAIYAFRRLVGMRLTTIMGISGVVSGSYWELLDGLKEVGDGRRKDIYEAFDLRGVPNDYFDLKEIITEFEEHRHYWKCGPTSIPPVPNPSE